VSSASRFSFALAAASLALKTLAVTVPPLAILRQLLKARIDDGLSLRPAHTKENSKLYMPGIRFTVYVPRAGAYAARA
jgi:hypothetical protein